MTGAEGPIKVAETPSSVCLAEHAQGQLCCGLDVSSTLDNTNMATEALTPTPVADVAVQDQLALAQAAAATHSDWAKVVELLNKTESQLNELDKKPKVSSHVSMTVLRVKLLS